MKFLITGGLGFIGSHAAIYFFKQGHDILIVDNLSRPKPNLIEDQENSFNYNYFNNKFPEISIEIANVCDRGKLSSIFKKFQPNVIIHAAGQTSAVDSIRNPQYDFENNVIGLFNALECSRLSSFVKNFIYLSTNKVYGYLPNNLTLIETDERYNLKNNTDLDKALTGINETYRVDSCPHTPYGVSKLAGDLYVQEYGAIFGMNTVVFRMSCIYGPRQFGMEEQGWISHFIINAIKDKIITIYGNGKQVRDILYIDDLLRLMKSYLNSFSENNDSSISIKGSLNQKVFNVGGGHKLSVSIKEVLSLLEKTLNKKIKLDIDESRVADQKYYVSDISKAKKTFNWEPKIDPQKGIEKCIQWLLKHEHLFK